MNAEAEYAVRPTRIRSVSVAVATYKPDRRFLAEQLDSILAQTHRVDEVVVVDDCSNDGTVEFLRGYIHEHGIKSWQIERSDQNKGVGASFRKALSLCKGDLVFLCDQDDVWLPRKVEWFVDAFNRHPEIHCLLGNYFLIDEQSQRITTSSIGDNLYFEDTDEPLAAGLYRVPIYTVLGHNVAPGATQAFTADVLEAFLHVRGHKRMHDWRINIVTALKHDGLYYTDEVLTLYRQHSQNVTRLRRDYLELPDRQRTSSLYARVVKVSWRHRADDYGRVSCFEFGNNDFADNVPKTIRKSYFDVCDPRSRALEEFERWERFIKASRRAVDKHSFLRFAKLRRDHRQCHKAHFQYWRRPERLACFLKDLNWCLFGWKAR